MRGFSANGRDYGPADKPVVVICVDGCEPAYLEEASAAGVTPALDEIRAKGTSRLARSAMPSFTNPNNMSIATGRPPSVHGICGNFFYDRDVGREVMMNDAEFLRVPTIFAAASGAGARVAVVTAKDKLLALLGSGLDFRNGRTICLSAERSSSSTPEGNGIDRADRWLGMEQPHAYSMELSEFVFKAGSKLLREWRPDLMYLSTTDYIQHKFKPGHPTANAFCGILDRCIGELAAAGAVVVVTADHGMKPKHRPDGSPSVVYLQDVLDRWLGEGAARVLLPITDPYVAHHGALGSFATVYLEDGADARGMIGRLRSLSGIAEAESGSDAAARYELPLDRIGDIVLISEEGMTIGALEGGHDLSMLDAPLRSHGGLSEQTVPFILNRKADLPDGTALRNYDAFQVAISAATGGNGDG